MERKKLIRNMFIIGGSIFVLSILIILSQFPYRIYQHKKRVIRLEYHVNALTKQYQEYLTETAKKIKNVPVDQHVISQIRFELLQERTNIKLYLWMVDSKGEFVFGVPSAVFNKMNNIFDKNREMIQKDGHFPDRNGFLLKLVDKHEQMAVSPFPAQERRSDERFDWRFYTESVNPFYYLRSFKFILSAPVITEASEGVGDLYLKIDDSANSELYYSRRRAARRDLYSSFIPAAQAMALFSGFFLWFLLPTWVYIDAKQRDVSNPTTWVILTLLSAFFGLAIYLLVRPSTVKSFYCPQCKNELNGTKAFCPYCGFDLAGMFCPQCQYPVKPEWQYCPSCRSELKKKPTKKSPPEKDSPKDK